MIRSLKGSKPGVDVPQITNGITMYNNASYFQTEVDIGYMNICLRHEEYGFVLLPYYCIQIQNVLTKKKGRSHALGVLPSIGFQAVADSAKKGRQLPLTEDGRSHNITRLFTSTSQFYLQYKAQIQTQLITYKIQMLNPIISRQKTKIL